MILGVVAYPMRWFVRCGACFPGGYLCNTPSRFFVYARPVLWLLFFGYQCLLLTCALYGVLVRLAVRSYMDIRSKLQPQGGYLNRWCAFKSCNLISIQYPSYLLSLSHTHCATSEPEALQVNFEITNASVVQKLFIVRMVRYIDVRCIEVYPYLVHYVGASKPVLPFQPKHRLGHPENYLFLLSKKIFIG